EASGHVAAVAVAVVVRRSVLPPHSGRPGAGGAAALAQAVDGRREHVELLRVGVLGRVVLARVGAKDLDCHLVRLGDERAELLRDLEVDHQTSRAPSITPAARRSRYQRSTGCSFTKPCPPSSCTPSEPMAMPFSLHSWRASVVACAKSLAWSARLAARQVARRMPSSSMPMSATANATPWRLAIGSPNATRSFT